MWPSPICLLIIFANNSCCLSSISCFSISAVSLCPKCATSPRVQTLFAVGQSLILSGLGRSPSCPDNPPAVPRRHRRLPRPRHRHSGSWWAVFPRGRSPALSRPWLTTRGADALTTCSRRRLRPRWPLRRPSEIRLTTPAGDVTDDVRGSFWGGRGRRGRWRTAVYTAAGGGRGRTMQRGSARDDGPRAGVVETWGDEV